MAAPHPVLIDGQWRETQAAETFHAYNPATGEALTERYPVSTWGGLAAMADAARRAAPLCEALPDEERAGFLERCAAAIEARADQIADAAALETGLPRAPRLREVELGRTTNQLRQAASAVRDGSWRMATIDTPNKLRSSFGPFGGAVLVIGPNNFPLAFNAVAGGDFASAIAAGNPVIAKAHPAHPGTSRLLAEAVHAAAQAGRMPPATVQFFYHCEPEDGARLLRDAGVAALAFTGSRRAGLALKRVADDAGKPAYLEMSSLNPVYLLPGALAERGPHILDESVSSCLLGGGQFCTKPGLVFLQGDRLGEEFIRSAIERFRAAAPTVQLTLGGPENLLSGLSVVTGAGAELLCGGGPASPGFRFECTLLRVAAARFLAAPHPLQTELFGPATLFVVADSPEELAATAAVLEGNLTGALYSATDGRDDALAARLAAALRPRVGRLLNDKMPTGVAVSPAMVHGGPFAATSHPGFTAVGLPASIRRFAAARCFDNVRAARLPIELRNANPTGQMWRLIDGVWTQGDAPA